MVHKLTGHEKEVSDLTCHPDKQLVSYYMSSIEI